MDSNARWWMIFAVLFLAAPLILIHPALAVFGALVIIFVVLWAKGEIF